MDTFDRLNVVQQLARDYIRVNEVKCKERDEIVRQIKHFSSVEAVAFCQELVSNLDKANKSCMMLTVLANRMLHGPECKMTRFDAEDYQRLAKEQQAVRKKVWVSYAERDSKTRILNRIKGEIDAIFERSGASNLTEFWQMLDSFENCRNPNGWPKYHGEGWEVECVNCGLVACGLSYETALESLKEKHGKQQIDGLPADFVKFMRNSGLVEP